MTKTFNGRHMTAVVAAVCVTIVLAPVSVLATSSGRATGPIKVYLTDPVSHTKAHVSTSGAVSVGGTVDVGNLPATQNVSGEVGTAPRLPGTPFALGASGVFRVPSTGHMVIQTLSITASVTAGDQIEAYVTFTCGGQDQYLYMPLSFTETFSGDDHFDSTESVNLYPDPGTLVAVGTTSPSGTPTPGWLDASGYTVP